MKNPNKTLPKATIWAVVSVILIYLLVAIGVTMILEADTLIENKEIALSIAGKKAFANTGLIIVTIAAAFSNGSAINATLFSTARLMESIAGIAALLAMLGSLSSLVDVASIIFLFTFGIVNFIAFQQKIKRKWLCLAGAICCGLAIITDIAVQIQKIPYAIVGLIAISSAIFLLRPYLLKRMDEE